MHAKAPNGKRIVAMCDLVPANSLIADDTFRRDPDGSIAFEWAGESVLCWDGQYTMQREGEDLYVDEDGETWRESEIKLVDVE